MKISEVIGYLNSYETDTANGIFNPVKYLGLAKISGFTTVRDKATKETFLIDHRGQYRSKNSLQCGRNPDAVKHLTGDYEFYTSSRVYLVGYLVPKNHNVSLNDAQKVKDQIIDNCLSNGIVGADNIKFIEFEKHYEDTNFGLRNTEDTYKLFAEFTMISTERLHEINRCSTLIGQSETIPYDTNAPENVIYIIVTNMDFMSRKQEMVEDTWSIICKMFSSDFDICRFAECDVGHYSN